MSTIDVRWAPAPTARAASARSPRTLSRAGWVASVALVLLVGLLVKEPELLLPIGPDQGTYSYVGERILHGDLPYVDAWDNKPPATYYVHAAVQALVPERDRWSGTCIPGSSQPCAYVALQVADVVWTMATALVVLALARRVGLGAFGSLASLLLFVVFANLSQLSKEGNTPEKELLLPMALAYLAVLQAHGQRKGAWLLLAGVMAGAAFLFKQTAVSIPVALAGWWVWQHRRRLRPDWRGLAAFGAGYVVPLAITAGYFASRGGLGALWDAAFGYNLVQADSNLRGLPHGLVVGAWQVFSGSSALLWLLGLAGGLLVLSRSGTGSARQRLLVCWAVADAASLGLGGAKFAQVYFVQLVPSLALLGGLALAEGWRLTRALPLLRGYAALVLASVLLLSNQFQGAVIMRAWYERTPPHSSTPAEKLVADHFRGGDRGGDQQPIFIWGDNSEMYLYAGARAPGRFFQVLALSRVYAARGYLERRAELLRSWQSTPPAIIAIDPATARDDPDGSLGLNVKSFPELQAYIAAGYRPLDGMTGGWQAYTRK